MDKAIKIVAIAEGVVIIIVSLIGFNIKSKTIRQDKEINLLLERIRERDSSIDSLQNLLKSSGKEIQRADSIK